MREPIRDRGELEHLVETNWEEWESRTFDAAE